MAPRRKKKVDEDYENEDSSLPQKYQNININDEALQEAPIEEQFILRIPERLSAQLLELVKSRAALTPEQLSIIFKDQRHGKISILGNTLSTTLVDLPCIIESLKTLDNKQYYKIADICQMLVAHERKQPPVQGKDYAMKDGLSFVFQDVKNSRFRKRMSKKIVEDVEQEVERLLTADYEAMDVTFEVLERKENEESENSEEDSDDDSLGVGINGQEDQDLDAAIDEALIDEQEEDEDDSDEEESDEFEEEEDPDEKLEENELKIAANSLKHEISAMEVKLAEKNKLASNQVNAIMKERFKGIVEKLAKELQLKREQLEKLQEEIDEDS